MHPSQITSAMRGGRRRTLLHHALALRNLLHEVGLNLLRVLGEALLVGQGDGLADGLFLLGALVLGLLLGGALGALALLLERAAEVGVAAALVVKVDGVGEQAGDEGADAEGDDGRCFERALLRHGAAVWRACGRRGGGRDGRRRRGWGGRGGEAMERRA